MRPLRNPLPLRPAALILYSLFAVSTVCAQIPYHTGPDLKGTDLKTHKFQPKVLPEAAAPAGADQTSHGGISTFAAQQMQALLNEKHSRTPAQRKVDSNVLYTVRMLKGQPAAAGVPYLYTGVDLDDSDNLVVDIVANVTDSLLSQLKSAGAHILGSYPAYRSVRAIVPPDQIERIASSPDVIFIWPKQEAITSRVTGMRQSRSFPSRAVSADFQQRAGRVRRHLMPMLSSAAASRALAINQEDIILPPTGQGSVTTEGDLTHRAFDARTAFGINGAGLRIGVLSDGVEHLYESQATGDLGTVTVLSGQTGFHDEGTAMLEIIHDMAPGAQLYFATAIYDIPSFVRNIRNLRAAGCDIIVDDMLYFVETPFQDGQTPGVISTTNGGLITQAVNDVVANGALYFSAAGNFGHLDDGTSGTFEGDFVDGGPYPGGLLPGGTVHDFGGGTLYDLITYEGTGPASLWWADPLGGSNNDYDLFQINSVGLVVGGSTNIQDGTQDPFEQTAFSAGAVGSKIVIWKETGASARFLHLSTYDYHLAVATAGETHGHLAASGAYTIVATPAAEAFRVLPIFPDSPIRAGALSSINPSGPYPNPFSSADTLELFSSDGPRRIFFNGDGTAITPGNFSSTGGTVLQKPDLTAADGVSVTGAGIFGTRFFGSSAAAPHAAAVAALVKSAKPALTSAQVRTALTSTAIDIMGAGADRNSGAGIVMAFEAVRSLGVTGSANPELGTITATDNPGNGNGLLEAGEGGKLVIQLKNTGLQTGRISRDEGQPNKCGSTKQGYMHVGMLPHAFDSYTATACRNSCTEVTMTSTNGTNLFTVGYTPAFIPANPAANSVADSATSWNTQTYGVSATSGQPYTFVVHEVDAGGAVGSAYNLQISACAFNCTPPNQVPVAIANNVTVPAGPGGTAIASVNNGSYDPDGDPLTITQIPAAPYPVGVTNVWLTVTDPQGATAQASATVTVTQDFNVSMTLPSVTVTAGQSITDHMTVTPNAWFGSAITFACSGLPQLSSCAFSPTSVTPGGAPVDTILTVSTTAPTAQMRRQPVYWAKWLTFSGLGLASIVFVRTRRQNRKTRAVISVLFLVIGLLPTTNCGGGSSGNGSVSGRGGGGTPPGTYTVTVAATSGSTSRSTTFTLVVN